MISENKVNRKKIVKWAIISENKVKSQGGGGYEGRGGNRARKSRDYLA